MKILYLFVWLVRKKHQPRRATSFTSKHLRRRKRNGILVHLFCMVGHPGTTIKDAELTVQFLIDNQELVDTADMVGFRLDKGTKVFGVQKPEFNSSDLAMSYEYEPLFENILSYKQVAELELACQEILWDEVPRLLHPLYRIGNSWNTGVEKRQDHLTKQI